MIWTNHAIQRMKDRKLPKSWAEETVSHPDQKSQGKDGGIEYRKHFGHQTVTVIVKEQIGV